MRVIATVILSLATIIYGQTRDAYYSNWMDVAGVDTANLGIVDIAFPGSRHAGMYKEGIESNGYQASTDDFYEEILKFRTDLSSDQQADWAQRQIGSVLDQLMAGSRFLDLRLEGVGSTAYAHNGLLGARLDTILDDIDSFMSTREEVVILSFSDFLNIGDVDADVFDKVESKLSGYMASTGYNIASDSINELITSGARVIPIYDDTTITATNANGYLQPASSVLSGFEARNATSSAVTLEVLEQLVNGLDDTMINQIYYALTITKGSEFTFSSNLHDTYLQYNADLAVTLRSTINNYPKLVFGNAIIVDFVEASNVVDQAIILNYNYASCSDTAANCAADTNLARDFKESGRSVDCESDATLQSDCERSCGECTWIEGVPGAACSDTQACDSSIYTAAGTTEGTCLTPQDEYVDFIGTDSFCLSPFAVADCGTISSDICNGDTSISDSCDGYCTSNAQCLSGYCNTGSSTCLEITTPTTSTTTKSDECYCERVTSDLAVTFREDINGFRPGDPDGEYTIPEGCSDPTSCSDANPYVASIVGFVVLPLVFSILMFVTYSCCFCFWCCCPRCSKRKCCKCCLGDPEENAASRWAPTVIMAAVLIVILWACGQGIEANYAMHDHLFSEDEQSVRTEVTGLFDVIIDKFDDVIADKDNLVGIINGAFDGITGITDSIDTEEIGNELGAIQDELNYISDNYTNYTAETTVTDPFTQVTVTQTVPCEYCIGLSSQIGGIITTLNGTRSTLNGLTSTLNSSSALAQTKGQINGGLSNFTGFLDEFKGQAQNMSNTASDIFEQLEAVDKQREQGGGLFFIYPIFWVILWVIGVLLAFFKKIPKIGEWCFKCTWCPAMFVGATVMLIFSFFGLLSVAWADFCVNLDQFEADPIGSNLGQSLINAAGADSTPTPTTPAPGGSSEGGFGSGGLEEVVEIVNACWTGADLFEVLNFSSLTDQIDGVRGNLTDSLNVDITSELTLDEFDSFVTEINLLSNDEFGVEGDRLIAALNAIGDRCTCSPDCSVTSSDPDGMFTRAKLQANGCYNLTGTGGSNEGKPWDCWNPNPLEVSDPNPDPQNFADCVPAFVEAYLYVQAELDLDAQTEAVIDDIQRSVGLMIQAYDNLFGIAVGIENAIKSISCLIDPVFDEFEAIIRKYSNCGFIGEIYGGFKEVGCVLLFGDMYWISVAMMVIAFFSILVVLCGFMTQYSWHPVGDDDDMDPDDFEAKIGHHAAQVSRQLSQRLSQRMLPGMDKDTSANEVEMADQIEAGGTGGTTQPPPPEGPPPEEAGPGGEGGGMSTDAQPPPPEDEPPQPSAPMDAPVEDADGDLPQADTSQGGVVI